MVRTRIAVTDLMVLSHQVQMRRIVVCFVPATMARLLVYTYPLKPFEDWLLKKMSAGTFSTLRISRRKQSDTMNTVKIIKSLLDGV